MAEGGNYEDSSSNSDPWSGVEYPEEEHGGEERTDEREKAEVHFPETRKLSPLLRNEAESKDWRIVEYFGWEQPEVERRRIIVIGMDTSTESEFAFQRKSVLFCATLSLVADWLELGLQRRQWGPGFVPPETLPVLLVFRMAEGGNYEDSSSNSIFPAVALNCVSANNSFFCHFS